MTDDDPDLLALGRRPPSTSRWVNLLQGRISAAGCPSAARLALWAERGATDVATLQRGDEMPPWLPAACEQAGMRWHHIPLSGRRLEGPADPESLARLPELTQVLRDQGSLVVHCAAGMHRTAVGLYIIMRHAGLSAEDTLDRIAGARPLTASELTRSTRRNGRLADKAESLFRLQTSIQEP